MSAAPMCHRVARGWCWLRSCLTSPMLYCVIWGHCCVSLWCAAISGALKQLEALTDTHRPQQSLDFTTVHHPDYQAMPASVLHLLGLNFRCNLLRSRYINEEVISRMTYVDFPKCKLRFLAHQISWVSDWVIKWVIEYAIFFHGLAQQWRLQKKQNLAQR